jgi:hypothetical protein
MMRDIQQQAADLTARVSGQPSMPAMMGLAADGQLVAQITESIADRIIRIRARLLTIGIPVAVGTGVLTTATFAGAFGLAKTERVWAPALLLGGVVTLAALVSVAVAAKTATAAANDAAAAALAANAAAVAAARAAAARAAAAPASY